MIFIQRRIIKKIEKCHAANEARHELEDWVAVFEKLINALDRIER